MIYNGREDDLGQVLLQHWCIGLIRPLSKKGKGGHTIVKDEVVQGQVALSDIDGHMQGNPPKAAELVVREVLRRSILCGTCSERMILAFGGPL